MLNSGMALAAHFGDGVLHARDVAAEPRARWSRIRPQDDPLARVPETVVKERSDWKDLASPRLLR